MRENEKNDGICMTMKRICDVIVLPMMNHITLMAGITTTSIVINIMNMEENQNKQQAETRPKNIHTIESDVPHVPTRRIPRHHRIIIRNELSIVIVTITTILQNNDIVK